MMDALKRNVGLAAGSLLASSATLLCCVLPAVLVSLGAGAAMVGLVTRFPQLVWLSERKAGVFTVAAILLVGGGVSLLNARRLPCPADPGSARACARLRRIAVVMYAGAALMLGVGALFAFGLPWLGA